MKKIRIELSADQRGEKYEVWVGRQLLDRQDLFRASPSSGDHAFILADSRLKPATARLEATLRSAGWKTRKLYLRANESLKEMDQIYPLYDWLLRGGADRNSVVFAVGGGVIGDAIGFLAGTYLRGIRWVGVPSTLLAQVDSAIGGKTGINLTIGSKKGKNLIGMFHQPIRVICDLDFLQTLSPRDLISGLGEMVKYGIALDSKLFTELEKNYPKVLQLDEAFLLKTIHRCLAWKARIVEKDTRDLRGVREVLNFGHSLGHALEAETGFNYFRHGEAVIWGMRMATQLSVLAGHLDASSQVRIDTLLKKLSVPAIPKPVTARRLIVRLKTDKKAKQGRVRFVLLQGVGKTILDRTVSDPLISASIEAFL
jgi:3-dehydroquinate synthase